MVEAETDQTTPMSSPSQAFPNPMSSVGVVYGAVWLYYKDTNPHRLLPRPSKSPDLRLDLGTWTTKVRPSNKEGEVMGNGDGGLDH